MYVVPQRPPPAAHGGNAAAGRDWASRSSVLSNVCLRHMAAMPRPDVTVRASVPVFPSDGTTLLVRSGLRWGEGTCHAPPPCGRCPGCHPRAPPPPPVAADTGYRTSAPYRVMPATGTYNERYARSPHHGAAGALCAYLMRNGSERGRAVPAGAGGLFCAFVPCRPVPEPCRLPVPAHGVQCGMLADAGACRIRIQFYRPLKVL